MLYSGSSVEGGIITTTLPPPGSSTSTTTLPPPGSSTSTTTSPVLPPGSTVTSVLPPVSPPISTVTLVLPSVLLSVSLPVSAGSLGLSPVSLPVSTVSPVLPPALPSPAGLEVPLSLLLPLLPPCEIILLPPELSELTVLTVPEFVSAQEYIINMKGIKKISFFIQYPLLNYTTTNTSIVRKYYIVNLFLLLFTSIFM